MFCPLTELVCVEWGSCPGSTFWA